MHDDLTPDAAPFSLQLFARWPDMDFNQHMRNAAFLGASEDCRMQFLAQRGFPMAELKRLQVGPVLLEDRLTYRKEIGLLEPFRVDLALAAATRDARRMKLRNTLYREDGAVAAVVESVVLWFDLAARRPIAPPAALARAWLTLARTDDFAWFPERA